MTEVPPIVPALAAVWVLVALRGFLFFKDNKEPAERRRFFPRFAAGSGALLALAIGLTTPWPSVLLFLPFIALVAWLVARSTEFCDGCGRTVINQQWWAKLGFCPFCGKKLTE